MPTSKPRRRRPAAPRLLCAAETVTAVEAALPQVIGATGQMISKTKLVDVIVAVGLSHMDEVADEVTRLLHADEDHDQDEDEDGPSGGETA